MNYAYRKVQKKNNSLLYYEFKSLRTTPVSNLTMRWTPIDVLHG